MSQPYFAQLWEISVINAPQYFISAIDESTKCTSEVLNYKPDIFDDTTRRCKCTLCKTFLFIENNNTFYTQVKIAFAVFNTTYQNFRLWIFFNFVFDFVFNLFWVECFVYRWVSCKRTEQLESKRGKINTKG